MASGLAFCRSIAPKNILLFLVPLVALVALVSPCCDKYYVQPCFGAMLRTMTVYAAFLGHQPKVSIAELAATVSGFKLLKLYGNNVLLFESSAELTEKDLPMWGGTILLAREIAPKASLDNVPKFLGDQTKEVKGKVTFALRGFGVPTKRLQMLYRECKQVLTKRGQSARYVGNEHKPAATALLRDEGIASGKHGCELVLLMEEDDLWVGKTIAAQDPDEYTKRDMHKPVRDTRVGLLPPKLAQVLLNLGAWAVTNAKGKLPKQVTVLDPFCGTGVIPMEALLKGWHVLASDLSLKAVNGCEKNLEWVRKIADIKKKDVTSKVWKQDATKPFDAKLPPPDMIVTEGSLGPALVKKPLAKDAQKLRAELDALELAFLKNIAQRFPGVPVVITFPVWHLKTGALPLERVWKSLGDMGYDAILPPGVRGDDPERPSIVYRRPDQFVGREIVILRPRRSA